MSKLDEIVNGWKNFVFKNDKVEQIAKDRMETCLNCTELKPNNRCGLCNCYMPAKVRSEQSRCPAGKWR